MINFLNLDIFYIIIIYLFVYYNRKVDELEEMDCNLTAFFIIGQETEEEFIGYCHKG